MQLISYLIVDGGQQSDTARPKSFTWQLHSLKNPEINASLWLHCREISSFEIFKMDWITRRYAPMSRDHILGFPNKMPTVDWLQNLPMFRNVEGNDAALHLVKFHIHVHKLNVDFPEDCLMKMFMATLEDESRSWYEILPPASIYCLRDFHTIFFERYK